MIILKKIRIEIITSFVNLAIVATVSIYTLILFLLHYSLYDFIIIFGFIIFIIALFILNIYLTIRYKSALLQILITLTLLLLYLIISLFNPFFLIFVSLNVISIIRYFTKFKIKPRFKSRRMKKWFYLVFLLFMIPLILTLVLELTSPTITVSGKDNQLDVNFYVVYEYKTQLGEMGLPLFTNSTPLNSTVVNRLVYWNNNLTKINISITLGLYEEHLLQSNSSAINNTKKLNLANIPVDVSLLLNNETVPWPNDENIQHFFDYYNDTFRNWKEFHNLTFRAFYLDMESIPLDSDQAFQELISLPGIYWSNTHDSAHNVYQQLIQMVKNDGMEIGITSYPFILPEDLFDHDDSIQKILHISYYPPANYDIYSLMSYSQGEKSIYDVYLNGKTMKNVFQDRAGMVINAIDEPLNSLIDKIQLLRNLGIRRITIHSLEGFLSTTPEGLSDLDKIFEALKEPKTILVPYSTMTNYYGFPLFILIKYLIFFVDLCIF